MWTELLSWFSTPAVVEPQLPQPTDYCLLKRHHQFEKGWYKIQGHMVNIRNSPALSGTVLKEIPIASLANVSECVKEETIGHKTGCWHQVTDITVDDITTHYEDAYIFSSALAPCFVRDNFDLDSVFEEAFLSDIKPNLYQIRIWDPNDKESVVTTNYTPQTDENEFAIGVDEEPNGGILWLMAGAGFEKCGGFMNTHYFMYVNNPRPVIHNTLSLNSIPPEPPWPEGHYHSVNWLNREDILLQTTEFKDTTENNYVVSTQHYCLKDFKFTPCSKKIVIKNTIKISDY